jgi:ribosomal protein S18 acetylase RimI-like enzyme
VFEIREAAIEDLDEVALIHALTIPHSINSAMGLNRLRGLYLITLLDKDSLLLVATEDNRVIGFISGTSEFRNLARGATTDISIRQIVNVFKKMNPFRLIIAAFDLILLSRAFQSLGNFYYFSTWGMLPKSPPAAGSALFRELVKLARNSGSEAVVVNVSKSNLKVLQMYRTLGFLPVAKTISELILKKQY